MSDIIERLRAAVPTSEGKPIAWRCEVRSELLLDAAAEVERLTRERDEARAEVERLSAALDRLARLGNEPNYGNSFGNVIARKALEAKP